MFRMTTVCALALALAAPAFAAPAGEAATAIKVGYSDLNLGNARDARILLRRLDLAAASACGASPFSVREYQQAVRQSSCYRDGLNRAVAAIDAPAVTSLYQAGLPYAVATN